MFVNSSFISFPVNIQTRMLFAGNLVKHPCFDELRKAGTGYRVVGNLELTDRIMNDTFWIGVYPGMSDEMIDRMIDVINGYFFEWYNTWKILLTGEIGFIG